MVLRSFANYFSCLAYSFSVAFRMPRMVIGTSSHNLSLIFTFFYLFGIASPRGPRAIAIPSSYDKLLILCGLNE